MKYEQNMIAFALSLGIVILVCGMAYAILWPFKQRKRSGLPPPDRACERSVYLVGREWK